MTKIKTKKMAVKQRGFALLVTVIMTGIFLSVGVAISTLVSKGLQLSSIGVASQRAFYAADTAFECALYHDSNPEISFYNYNGTLNCAGQNIQVYNVGPGPNRRYFQMSTTTSCARVNIEATPHPDFSSVNLTKIVSRGYNVACNQVAASPQGVTVVERALEIIY